MSSVNASSLEVCFNELNILCPLTIRYSYMYITIILIYIYYNICFEVGLPYKQYIFMDMYICFSQLQFIILEGCCFFFYTLNDSCKLNRLDCK